jgi:predicted porin
MLMPLIICANSALALSGLRLLAVEAGARPVGMGGAFASVASDPYSMAYNPAAAYKKGPLAVSAGYNSYWQNIKIQTAYLSFEKKAITYSVGFQYGAVSNLEGRTAPSSDYYPFDAHDISLKTGASFRIDKDLVFGFALGWIFEKIESYRGSVLSADLGILATPIEKLNLGISALNLGSKMSIRKEKYSIPKMFRVGLSYEFKEFLPVVDLVIQDDKTHLHAGGEYSYQNMFFLRGGYRTGYDLNDFSLGAGFSKRNLRVDYAFMPYKEGLNDSHLISLTFNL